MEVGTLVRVHFVYSNYQDWRDGRIVDAGELGIVIKDDKTGLQSLITASAIIVIDELEDTAKE